MTDPEPLPPEDVWPPPLDQIPSPWVWDTSDYRGKVIRITINWDTSNGGLMGAIGYRDPECVYTRILIGLSDVDGTPDSTPDQWTLPPGETLIRHNLLRKARLRNINDILVRQITAGF